MSVRRRRTGRRRRHRLIPAELIALVIGDDEHVREVFGSLDRAREVFEEHRDRVLSGDDPTTVWACRRYELNLPDVPFDRTPRSANAA